jgi:hypothetical protein
MPKTLFRITYRLRAHNIEEFEKILLHQIMPIVQELGIPQPAIWKGFVGDAGEFMELWEFESMSDFEQKWRNLMDHPRLREIFQITGPMVENEQFSLFEPLERVQPESDLNVKHYSV